jgi:hypothetical protein
MLLWDVVLSTLVGETVGMEELAAFVFRVEMMGGDSSEILVQNCTLSMQKLLLICIQVASSDLGQGTDYPG